MLNFVYMASMFLGSKEMSPFCFTKGTLGPCLLTFTILIRKWLNLGFYVSIPLQSFSEELRRNSFHYGECKSSSVSGTKCYLTTSSRRYNKRNDLVDKVKYIGRIPSLAFYCISWNLLFVKLSAYKINGCTNFYEDFQSDQKYFLIST